MYPEAWCGDVMTPSLVTNNSAGDLLSSLAYLQIESNHKHPLTDRRRPDREN